MIHRGLLGPKGTCRYKIAYRTSKFKTSGLGDHCMCEFEVAFGIDQKLYEPSTNAIFALNPHKKQRTWILVLHIQR